MIVTLAIGATLIATTQFVRQVLQKNHGYTATWAGLALSPGGLVNGGGDVHGRSLPSGIQPKYLIATGATIIAMSMYDLTRLSPGADVRFFV